MKGIIFFRIATKVNALETFGDMYSDAEKEKIGKNKEVYTYTNEGIITPENWNELKDEFVKQRLSKYKDSYTLQFKIKQELKILDSSNFKSFDHNFLKNEYKDYLEKMNAEPQQKTEKKKAGRKETKVKDATEYLKKIDLPENKVKFLNILSIQYSTVPHKIFNHVMIALNDLGYLIPAEKKEYRIAFEKALGRKQQSPSNFNIQFVEPKNADPLIYDGIKENISNIIQSNTLV